ncbi:hypothetical protein OOU_Y34scaffold00240g58 [Pyricularia oryzae Y34]|uniref:Uncharacterized protein n=1 Tax=Pyricularia oryzae (strain Y34) TaxID=1143189 RepID=A0AA97P4Q8_PYRO3|nr:hypothetical protein OOU_Y34scaffold00240g58 [Pyricularia oryzae Y34]
MPMPLPLPLIGCKRCITFLPFHRVLPACTTLSRTTPKSCIIPRWEYLTPMRVRSRTSTGGSGITLRGVYWVGNLRIGFLGQP